MTLKTSDGSPISFLLSGEIAKQNLHQDNYYSSVFTAMWFRFQSHCLTTWTNIFYKSLTLIDVL